MSRLKAFAENKSKCYSKLKIYFSRTRKHCGKWEKRRITGCPPSPKMFSKGLCYKSSFQPFTKKKKKKNGCDQTESICRRQIRSC